MAIIGNSIRPKIAKFCLELRNSYGFSKEKQALKAQGRNQCGARGAAPPPVKSWAPSIKGGCLSLQSTLLQ